MQRTLPGGFCEARWTVGPLPRLCPHLVAQGGMGVSARIGKRAHAVSGVPRTGQAWSAGSAFRAPATRRRR